MATSSFVALHDAERSVSVTLPRAVYDTLEHGKDIIVIRVERAPIQDADGSIAVFPEE
jgi:hypothetical protein